MKKFLVTYLLVTGVAAALVLAIPSLVIIGFFLLIIPGLLLGLSPTAFLWGLCFAIIWWLARTFVRSSIAAVIALVATAAVVTGATSSERLAGQQVLAASILPDVVTSARIAPRGDIRIDIPDPRVDNSRAARAEGRWPLSCDNLCIALLFTPGVTSVTMNDSSKFSVADHRGGTGPLAEGARTYRLRSKSECSAEPNTPDLEGRVGLFGKSLADNQAIADDWKLRLATDVCLASGPPLARYDLMLRSGRYVFPEKAGNPRYGERGEANVNYTEIRNGSGKVLIRRFVSKVPVLARVLYAEPTGSLSNFHWHWGEAMLSSAGRYAEVDFTKTIGEQTTLGRQSAPADLLPRIRQRLRNALSDPSLGGDDLSFATMETWFTQVSADRLSDEDLKLAVDLIADDRLIKYPGLWTFKEIPADQQRWIADAIVRRILTTKGPLELRSTYFSDYLAKMPEGTYGTLSPDEVRLLANPERRIVAAGLIERLSDAGPTYLPLILDIMRVHGVAYQAGRENQDLQDRRGVEGQSAALDASRVALCRLGSDAAPALSQVEQMIATGIVPSSKATGFDGMEWNITLARLGKPIDTLMKPKDMSGTDESHRANIRRRLANFDPKRDCSR